MTKMAGGNNTDCWGVFDPRELQESQELHKWPFPTSHLLDDSESPKEKMKGDTSITSHNYGRTIQPTFWSFNLKARRADHTYVRSPAAAISVESLPTSAYYTSWVTALRAMGKNCPRWHHDGCEFCSEQLGSWNYPHQVWSLGWCWVFIHSTLNHIKYCLLQEYYVPTSFHLLYMLILHLVVFY